jgi:hypothetical protein
VAYDFDPEYAWILGRVPHGLVLDRYLEVRAAQAANAEMTNERIDCSMLEITEAIAPGVEGDPDVPVTIYRQRGLAANAPCVLRIHGGGFVLGSVREDLPLTAFIASTVPAVVVSVEYRLAPEHPFPAGHRDCRAALAFIFDQADHLGIDRKRVALYGTSAGAGLAAGVALANRDEDRLPICFQLLEIPELDDRLATPSMVAFVDTPVWNRPNAEHSWAAYLGSPAAQDVSPYAAPARATDLAGLPATYLSVMEFDPLRDEGVLFALGLMRAGVPVELHAFPGTFHGSVMDVRAEVSQRILGELSATLTRALRERAQ